MCISDIIDSVLKKCIELFEKEQKADFPEDSINYGKLPKTALVAYGMGKMGKVGCLKETDMKREIGKEHRNGMSL